MPLQTGFFDFVALPLVHAMSSAFPGAAKLNRFFLGECMHTESVRGSTEYTRTAAAESLLSTTTDNYNYWKKPVEASSGGPNGTGAVPPTPSGGASGKSVAAVAPEPQSAAGQPAAAQLEQPEPQTPPQPRQGAQGPPLDFKPGGAEGPKKQEAAPLPVNGGPV